MSKVAISGNASGTGVFTIAAPNSNINYTISLPTTTGGSFIASDSNGFIGIKGAASSSFTSTYQVIQYNGGPALWSANNANINLSSNLYNDGSNKYLTSSGVGFVNVYSNGSTGGGVSLNGALSGTAGNVITVGATFLVSPTDCLMTTANGGLGYGTGAGGTVTQATSKSTAVTLNKPTGQITMNAAALAAGASISFALNNTLITAVDILTVNVTSFGSYLAQCVNTATGAATIRVTNITGGSLSEALTIQFAIIKGATA